MGKLYNTKIFLLLVLVLLMFASGARLNTQMKEEEKAGAKAEVPTTPLPTPVKTSVEKQNLAPKFFATDNSLEFYMSSNDRLEERISTSKGKYYSVSIARGDKTLDKEVDSIKYDENDVNNKIRDEYKKIRDASHFHSCKIYVFTDAFYIVPDVTDEKVTFNRDKLFDKVLALSDKYKDINHLLSIDDDLTVEDVELAYYLDREKKGIASRDFHIALTLEKGYYRVEALSIDLKTILIKVPKVNTYGTWVSYQGVTDLDNGSDIKTVDTQNINAKIPISANIWSSHVGKFNKDEPEFEWDIRLKPNQMNINVLISVLDQDNSIDRRISPQLGETDDAPFDNTHTLVAPKGLDSFNLLPVLDANITSKSGSMKHILIKPDVPDFAFLPLELQTVSNECTIIYVSGSNYHVKCDGKTTIDGDVYHSFFNKESDLDVYNITLTGEAGSTLSFPAIKKYIFTTMVVGSTSSILTSDADGLAKLEQFEIYEDTTVFEDPVIDISYENYLMYKIKGGHTYGPEHKDNMRVAADFVNLDGSIFSYVRFFFGANKGQQNFYDFFNITDGDSGFESFQINDFQLISSNRDFNTDLVSQLRHSNIMVFQNQDVLVRNGVTPILNTDARTDCGKHVFCRLLKELKVASDLTFSAVVKDAHTQFISNFANFTLNNGVNFKSNKLQIDVVKHDDGNYASLTLKGRMFTKVEPDREISFKTTWSFDEDPTKPIQLSGKKDTIYDNVFKTKIIDMIEGKVQGTINLDKTITGFKYTSTALLGNRCYQHEDYVQALKSESVSPLYKVKDFDSTDINNNGELEIIGKECKAGKSVFQIFTDDPNKNTFTSNFFFDDYEDFLRVVYDIKSDDSVSPTIKLIEFPDGLLTPNTYEKVKDNNHLEFTGRMDFLGVHSFGHVHAYTNQDKADSVLYLPSFSIGGGNLQVLTTEDMKTRYHVTEDNACEGRLDCKDIDADKLKQNNTMKFSFDTKNVRAAEITMDSNIVLFDILNRASIKLNKEKWTFNLKGKPFRGAFDADVSVKVAPVPDIQKESNSKVSVVLDKSDNYHELENLVNGELEKWVSNIITVKLQVEDREKAFLTKRNYLSGRLALGKNCKDIEQCQDLPKIRCAEYAQKAVCVKEEKVCETVSQQCSKKVKHTTNWGSYEVCEEYETVCEDDIYKTVCVAYNLKNIPDECVSMELTCNKVMGKDVSCSEDIDQLKADIKEVDDKLVIVDELKNLIEDLTDTSVCLLKVTDEKDKQKYASCDEKDITLKGTPEDFDILNFFSIRDIRSEMKLRNVVSSSSMIFQSDVSLYGDWTTKKGKKDRMMIKNKVHVEREDHKNGYDLGIESLILINHVLDFNSVNHTSYQMAESVKQVVCKENHVGDAESVRIDLLLRELSLVEGNSTLCPILEIMNNKVLEEQDNLGHKQTSIFKEDKEKYIKESVENTKVSGLTFSYKPNAETVPVSDLREHYALEKYVTDSIPQPLSQRINSQSVEQKLEAERTLDERKEKEKKDTEYMRSIYHRSEEKGKANIDVQKRIDKDQQDAIEAQKQAEERRKQEKEEQAKKQKEAEEKRKAEQAEKEKQAREALEKAKQEKIEKEKKEQEEKAEQEKEAAEKQQKEKEEAEKQRAAAEEEKKKKQEEAEKAKEEAEKAQAEAEKKEKEQQEKAKEEQEKKEEEAQKEAEEAKAMAAEKAEEDKKKEEEAQKVAEEQQKKAEEEAEAEAEKKKQEEEDAKLAEQQKIEAEKDAKALNDQKLEQARELAQESSEETIPTDEEQQQVEPVDKIREIPMESGTDEKTTDTPREESNESENSSRLQSQLLSFIQSRLGNY